MKIIQFHVFILCTFCFFNSLSAQRWNNYQPNSIDLIFGVEYGHRMLSSNSIAVDDVATNRSDLTDYESIIRDRNNLESSKANYRIGFNYNYLITEKLFLKTGIRYVNAGYKTKNPVDLSTEDRIALSESKMKFRSYRGYYQSYQLLEFPLALRYVYSENWCKSYIEAGFSANHYLQTKLKGKKGNGRNDSLIFEQDLKPWHISSSLAIGAEFLIQNTLPAFIQMTARYQLTSMSKTEIKERLVAMGIETGFRYEF